MARPLSATSKGSGKGMARTLEQLQAQRDKIVEEMGGPETVQFADRSVTRRPQADLEKALRLVDAEIAALQSGQSGQDRVFTIQTNRGL